MVDGRRVRREQNRRAIVETLVELYGEGRYDATAAEIAERAGLSPRSLFRYFDDTDDLARAAIEHQQAIARPLLRIDAKPGDDIGTRVDALVVSRMKLWRTVGPSARAARMRAVVSPVVAAELRQARAYLRTQLEDLFPEVEPPVIAALDVMSSFESLELLLHDQHLSRTKAAAVLARSLRALLADAGGSR